MSRPVSEFSPDSIQFQANPAPLSEVQASAWYQQLDNWRKHSKDPGWKQWLTRQQKEELLHFCQSLMQAPNHLEALQDNLRQLRMQMTAMNPSEGLLKLITNWQKQAESLALGNLSAYQKSKQERDELRPQLAEEHWTLDFLWHSEQLEAYLAREAQQRFPAQPSLTTPVCPQLPSEGVALTQRGDKNYLPPDDLPLSIYQRSAKTWLKRAMRYLQLAKQDEFKRPELLKKCFKSLYACLELSPDQPHALLLLGWLHACCQNPTGALRCLERIRQSSPPEEAIFLIRFLQNRPLL